MRRIVYLPEDLAAQIDEYLADHPGSSFSSLVRELLEARTRRRNTADILKLAGIVKHASMGAREYDENPFGLRDR